MSLNLEKMATEGRNPNSINLDEMSCLEIVQTMNNEDKTVAYSIEKQLDKIAEAVSAIEKAFLANGRLFYIGAGTSGRLGIVDASECPPTYGTDPGQVVGIIAGGDGAIRTAVEGAEDSRTLPVEQLSEYNLTENDVVVGLAASGRTPYVIAGLEYAKSLGCTTVAISCNKGSEIGAVSDIAIEVEVGPEVLTGSTRLKAATAQKMILNMLTTASMVRIGKAYQNLMVDMVQSNKKLVKRANRIVMQATGCDEQTAVDTLKLAEGNCKLAIVMILTENDATTAKQLLADSQGHVKQAIRNK